MDPLRILRLEGTYSKENGKEIEYTDERNLEAQDILIFVGFQSYYLGERFSTQLLDDIKSSLKFNFPELYWTMGPLIRLAPAYMGMELSVGFWGQKHRNGYQFLFIVDEGIITKICVKTLFDV